MDTENLNNLAVDIKAKLDIGHRGYTLRGAQMDWVIQVLRFYVERHRPEPRRDEEAA